MNICTVCQLGITIDDSRSNKQWGRDLGLDEASIRRHLKHGTRGLAEDAKNVRILTIDIESKPMLVYSWGLWDQNHSIGQIVDHGGMICFAAKWAGTDEIIFKSVHHDGYKAMLQSAWDLLTEADIIVTYNGVRYDVKRLNNEFLLAGMRPPKPYKHVDLIKTNKARFDLPSRKLDYLVQRLGIGAKQDTGGFQLWIDCMAGDTAAWETMRTYNIQDVKVTEAAYLRLLPWLTDSPHLGMYSADGKICPYCGSKKLKTDGNVHTYVQSYWAFECGHCGGWSRSTGRLQDATVTRSIR